MSGEPRPIFVAGPARSGTTLMRSILNKHPNVWVSNETDYFDRLRVRLRGYERAPLSPEQRGLCEAFFRPLLARDDRVFGAEEVEEDAVNRLRALAVDAGDGADAYFEAFCRFGAARRGRARWGEKTPRNVFRLDEIFEFAPDAQVVCTLRDPRAVVASYRDHRTHGAEVVSERFASERRRLARMYHPILVSLVWRASVAAAFRARARYGPGRVYILRYEDLVTSPENSVRRLSEWLGIEHAESMLEVEVIGSSYIVGYRGESGFSTKSLNRWEKTLSSRDVAGVQSTCRRLMLQLGYDAVAVPGELRRAAGAWATAPHAACRALIANRARIGSARAYVSRRLALATRSLDTIEAA